MQPGISLTIFVGAYTYIHVSVHKAFCFDQLLYLDMFLAK